jgi:hypothetical protein
VVLAGAILLWAVVMAYASLSIHRLA